MPKLHSPVPQELEEEFEKVASIIDHFVKGATSLDSTLIPEKVINNCKGVAVLTIVKAGFVWSGRAGSGLVLAKLPDGSWSAPSAIAAGGAGFGAQIGAEISDTILILNTDAAVKAFTQPGNLTFGANLSIAAGPTGRQAEARGALVGLAPIYSYSKTKGLFAGLSLEGLILFTRKETNARFYNEKVTAEDLLNGTVARPPQAQVLYRALNRRGFGSMHAFNNTMRHASSTANLPRAHPTTSSQSSSLRNAASSPSLQSSQTSPVSPVGGLVGSISIKSVTAAFDFDSEQAGDLGFKAGEKIEVLEEVNGDWWKGEIRSGGTVKVGMFPANHVQ
ncbi:hypothetical protein HDU98_008594 [Podochytrium sp. JEL0797]|nr:hypothetical protein HDU98_008594 [Podochytrium sp. JEL0797]